MDNNMNNNMNGNMSNNMNGNMNNGMNNMNFNANVNVGQTAEMPINNNYNAEPVLQTGELTKVYSGKTVLNKVNMTVKRGDIYGFIGKNGAGKTTLMRIVLGHAGKTSGDFKLFGGENMRTAGKKMGSLIEAPALYMNCTALENLNRFSILSNADPKYNQWLLDYVGLGNAGKKKAGQFSLGMRQRLGIAIALLGNPEFLILDEPVNGLDPEGIKEVRELIIRLNQERKMTVLISSHLLDELSKMVTCYGIINQGNLIEEISVAELEDRCTKRLIIHSDNPEKTLEILRNEGQVKAENIGIYNDIVHLSADLDRAAEFNKMLVLRDVNVDSIHVYTSGLEDYFVNRIGKGV